jgi:hypothetical protein
MKFIVLAITLALIAPAVAQHVMPRTVPLMGKDGQQIGTATFAGPRIFLRDNKNEIFVQIVIEPDGTRTMYDPNGKVLDRIEPKK